MENIIIKLYCIALFFLSMAQSYTLRGTVMDESDNTLEDVRLELIKEGTSTLSGGDGSYILEKILSANKSRGASAFYRAPLFGIKNRYIIYTERKNTFVSFRLLLMNGKLAAGFNAHFSESGKQSISLAGFKPANTSPGIYFLQVIADHRAFVQKVLKFGNNSWYFPQSNVREHMPDAGILEK